MSIRKLFQRGGALSHNPSHSANAAQPVLEARPETSEAARAFEAEFGVPAEQARLLTSDAALADFFREAHRAHSQPKALANWITTELLRELKERTVAELPFSGQALGELIQLLDSQVISTTTAKEVFAQMLASGATPASIVKERGLGRIGDDAQLKPLIETVLAAHPEHVSKYRAGQIGLLGALVGQVMKKTGGRADAQRVSELLKQILAS